MAPPVFPALIGLAYPVKRSPKWTSASAEALSSKRVRLPLQTYPTYNFELPFRFLRSAAAFQEWQTLVGFINSVYGTALLFAYDDVNDDTVSNQQFGVGDGSTTSFQLVRSLGGFTEPVFLLNGTPTIAVAGTPTGAFTVSAYGVVTFSSAPAASAALTWSGQFYWPCRFDDDVIEITQDYSQIFAAKSVKFTSEKLP